MIIYMVVMIRNDDLRVLCFTENDEPAVYNDPAGAEYRAGQLRQEFPENHYSVIDVKVLP